jgi:flagellar FliL protein
VSDEKKPKKKAGKAKKLIILGAALAVLVGGGTAGGFYVAGGFKEIPGKKEDYNRPQLVLKGENAEEIGNDFAAKAHADEGHAGHGTGKHAKAVSLPAPKDASRYEATYFQIPAPFTSNLSDSDSFAQVSIAISTYYDNRVVQAITTHEMAIRSAILLMMAQESELELSTPAGKEHLQGELKKIINGVLREKTGYDGVDNVYFTNFVIQ